MGVLASVRHHADNPLGRSLTPQPKESSKTHPGFAAAGDEACRLRRQAKRRGIVMDGDVGDRRPSGFAGLADLNGEPGVVVKTPLPFALHQDGAELAGPQNDAAGSRCFVCLRTETRTPKMVGC